MGVNLAVAAFVKTPGISPLKTRLAQTIGTSQAETFYRLACAAVLEVLEQVAAAGGVDPHWAVAEEGTQAQWPSLPVLSQGAGELGTRLDHVYRRLHMSEPMSERDSGLYSRRAAVLIGADAPQLEVRHFDAARAALEGGSPFVIGPATDGGFYLFAGTCPIETRIWQSIPYSASNTAARLAEALAPLGKVAWLEPMTDVDTADDLAVLASALARLSAPLPAQARLARWLETSGLL